ncbi:hypothetical protein CSOJ01_03065 [Colletotrichum sojae]|uniref:Uncharacterized protein n=1 Tax=Colletotrichum sojae TaxID=2175907 RepID=A0A8H6JP01_9PEZI|nr:hypothetical protein CSOJ01_03065 [Colletotrichum sojae]
MPVSPRASGATGAALLWTQIASLGPWQEAGWLCGVRVRVRDHHGLTAGCSDDALARDKSKLPNGSQRSQSDLGSASPTSPGSISGLLWLAA